MKKSITLFGITVEFSLLISRPLYTVLYYESCRSTFSYQAEFKSLYQAKRYSKLALNHLAMDTDSNHYALIFRLGSLEPICELRSLLTRQVKVRSV